MDAVFDCWLCYCAAEKFNNWTQGSYEWLQIWTGVSVVFCIIEIAVFNSDCCNNEDKNGMCSDILSVVTLWTEDVPKAVLNVHFVDSHKLTFHWCCFCKVIFVAVRAVGRIGGAYYQSQDGRGSTIYNGYDSCLDCLRPLYAIGLMVEAMSIVIIAATYFGK